MLIINKIQTKIIASNSKGNTSNYGFKVTLNKGLNIITGTNTTGKSTILSCVYYCLGVEALLGAKNSEALGSAVKKEFYIEKESFSIQHSEALLNVSSGNRNVILRRKIKTGTFDVDEKKIYIKECNNEYVKFLNSKGDTLRENGFFNWLEKFIGIQLPNVSTYKGGVSKLYFQNIFSALFIEQKKGWSDYYSTTPNYAIKNLKEKIFEFLLGLNSIKNDFERDEIEGSIKNSKQKWKFLVQNLNKELEYIQGKVQGLSPDKLISKTKLDSEVSVYYVINGTRIKQAKYVLDLTNSIKALDDKITIGYGIKDEVNLNKQYELEANINKIEQGITKLNLRKKDEIEKIKLYKQNIENLLNKKDNLNDLKKIKENNSIDVEGYSSCPICHRSFSELTKLSDEFEEKDFQNSIKFIENQRSLFQTYLKTSFQLQSKIETHLTYYYKLLNDNKMKLQIFKESLYDDSRLPSKEIILEQLILKQKLNRIESVNEIITRYKTGFVTIYSEYIQAINDLNKLKSDNKRDLKIIIDFVLKFKKRLNDFGYDSQDISQIDITIEEPFKLLPSVKSIYGEGRESIQITSSASDFIRTLWAFYITLLEKSSNNIGILMFDEPGQQAMMLSSMQSLVKDVSMQKDKQIIFAISKNKQGNQNLNLLDILKELEEGKDYTLYEIPNKAKCIQHI
jgi:hypothetical protein